MEYNDKVMDHFANPRNVGKMDNPDATATEGSYTCGDLVTFYLKINDSSQIIEDVKFLSYGCASNIATASVTSEMAKGKTVEDAKKLTWKEITDELNGLPGSKIHCSVLAVDTLKSAIKDYEIKKGLRVADPFTKDTIFQELKKVIYPPASEDICTLKMVKYVYFDDGIATIIVDLPNYDQYKEHIFEDIKETLSRYPEVKEVKVQ
ncbi:MAG: iron-sulfur cluster assembly scaffold protein [Candidatus Cloacimonetes bacterium]|nr:iron-sulfur cluster assembly scaffold protein [Candidatus Cloacimonadota bacterium]